ncbi:MAG: hypothetical protein RM347_018005 [Nostoc sp. ChiQUE02]
METLKANKSGNPLLAPGLTFRCGGLRQRIASQTLLGRYRALEASAQTAFCLFNQKLFLGNLNL